MCLQNRAAISLKNLSICASVISISATPDFVAAHANRSADLTINNFLRLVSVPIRSSRSEINDVGAILLVSSSGLRKLAPLYCLEYVSKVSYCDLDEIRVAKRFACVCRSGEQLCGCVPNETEERSTLPIMFIRAQVISRGAGRSAIAAAAYRHRSRMIDEQTGVAYRSRGDAAELVHEELALPADVPTWLHNAIDGRSIVGASQELWNAVEEFETRVDAQLARELIIALPGELTREENIALVRDFVDEQVTGRGMVADWVYHDKPGNPHIHLLMTLRPLTEDGFGPKKIAVIDEGGQPLRMPASDPLKRGKQVYLKWAGDRETMKEWKIAWADIASRHLALAGHAVRLDGRSYEEQGIGGLARRHLSPAKAASRRQGAQMLFAPAELAQRQAMAERLLKNPEVLLTQLSNQYSTFDERDIARALNRYVDDSVAFANIRAKLMASDELVLLKPQRADWENGAATEPAVYTTRQMLRTEWEMVKSAEALASSDGFAIGGKRVSAAIERVEHGDCNRLFRLDGEQVDAVHHVIGNSGIAAVVGVAGAGKSTLLEAARLAWQGDGRRVIGGALAGKAAEGLAVSSGIPSRTLASWELAWSNGHDLLRRGDVFVIDEAGMVPSRQMARMLKVAEEVGAKVVLVGDAMQLQPIGAGAAFRAVAERIGFSELSDVRRQQQQWARAASRQFSKGAVEQALDAYAVQGHIIETQSRDEAIDRIVADWSRARKVPLDDSKDDRARSATHGETEIVLHSHVRLDPSLRGDQLLVLAHTNESVKRLNEALRAVMKREGALNHPRAFRTERGMREFAIGDRVIFLENARISDPGRATQSVKNGMLGTVASTTDRLGATLLVVRLDDGRKVVFDESQYRNIDHGYAVTIHKSQGTTVERSFVLASGTMDRHLTYVAMTRHRHRADLYASREDFATRPQWGGKSRVAYDVGVSGELIETGQAKFREGKEINPTPYADLRMGDGRRHRLWGASLPAALAKANAAIGDTVTLRRVGVEPVTVKVLAIDEQTGTRRYRERQVERNVWTAIRLETAGERQSAIEKSNHRPKLFNELVERLSRSGAKSTTLDYEAEDGYRRHAEDFGRRRGIYWLSDKAGAIEDVVHRRLAGFAEKRRLLAALWERAGSALASAVEKERRMIYDCATDVLPDINSASGAVSASSARNRPGHSLTASPAAMQQASYSTDPSISPMIPAVTEFSMSIKEEARDRAQAVPSYQYQRKALMQAAERIWRDPTGAVQTIEDLVIKGVQPNRIAAAVENDPAAYGALRGSGRMLDRLLAAGRERKQAIKGVAYAVRSLTSLGLAYASLSETESQAVADQRRRMGIAIPGLSQTAQGELTRLAAALKETRELSTEMIAGLDPKTRHEFATVSMAVDARFGRNAMLRGDKEIANLLAGTERKNLEVIQDNLKVLQQAVRVSEHQEIIAQRNTRITIPPRTIGG